MSAVPDGWVTRNFETLRSSVAGSDELAPLRSRALESFSKLGFPSAKHEEWRYTNITALTRGNFTLPSAGPAPKQLEKIERAAAIISAPDLLVFVDGHFAAELSKISLQDAVFPVSKMINSASSQAKSTFLSNLASVADAKDDPFVALNTAFIRDGAFVWVPRGKMLSSPIHLLFVSSKNSGEIVSHLRNLIVLEQGAKAEIVEHFLSLGDGASFTQALTEVSLAADSSLRHYRLNQEAAAASHISSTVSKQGSNSSFSTFALNFGGKLVRNDIVATLAGKGAETHLHGLTVICGEQHVDNHTVLDHAVEQCQSNEHYRGIYADSSKGVFSGSIVVRPDAQKTNAYQSNKSLLLSDRASSDSKPQLRIWADDVKCTHGATVGQLDQNALFYLRSRGIPKAAAKRILVQAFAAEVLKEIDNAGLVSAFEQILAERLNQLTLSDSFTNG